MEDADDFINKPFDSLITRRNPKNQFRGTDPLSEVQWADYYKAEHPPPPPPPPAIKELKDYKFDPFVEHDTFRQQTSDLILERFTVDFPSLEEMQDSNHVPDEHHLESEIQKLKEAYPRYVKILEEWKDEELESLHKDVFRTALMEDDTSITNWMNHEDVLLYSEWEVAARHDDLLLRTKLTHNKRLQQLLSELKTLRSHEKLPPAECFPSTIEEFRQLSEDPDLQYCTARYLICEDEEGRKRWFTEGGSGWRKQDTYLLRKEVQENPTFREEVIRVIDLNDQKDPLDMDLDMGVPGLTSFDDEAL